jgi:hypothetical protein
MPGDDDGDGESGLDDAKELSTDFLSAMDSEVGG